MSELILIKLGVEDRIEDNDRKTDCREGINLIIPNTITEPLERKSALEELLLDKKYTVDIIAGRVINSTTYLGEDDRRNILAVEDRISKSLGSNKEIVSFILKSEKINCLTEGKSLSISV